MSEDNSGAVIMDAEGVKRIVPREFALCGSRETMERLGEAIIAAAKGLENYGWVYVRLSHPASSEPNTPPLPWRRTDV